MAVVGGAADVNVELREGRSEQGGAGLLLDARQVRRQLRVNHVTALALAKTARMLQRKWSRLPRMPADRAAHTLVALPALLC